MSAATIEGTITLSEEGSGAWLLALHGEHDLATAPLIHATTRELWAQAAHVTVDLSTARFIDYSTVVRWLLTTQQALEASGTCILSVVEGATGSLPTRIIDLLHLRDKLTCYASRADVPVRLESLPRPAPSP